MWECIGYLLETDGWVNNPKNEICCFSAHSIIDITWGKPDNQESNVNTVCLSAYNNREKFPASKRFSAFKVSTVFLLGYFVCFSLRSAAVHLLIWFSVPTALLDD